MTPYYIFYESNIVFDTTVDVRMIPNQILDNFCPLSYPLYLQLLLDKHYIGLILLFASAGCRKNVSLGKIGANKIFVNSY